MADNLHKYDIALPNEPSINNNSFGTSEENKSFIQEMPNKLMLHLLLGAELILSPNFFIRGGYNYRRRQELMLTDSPGFTGFSAGFGLRISKLQISYGIAKYHQAGTSSHFSVSTNLSSFGGNTKN